MSKRGSTLHYISKAMNAPLLILPEKLAVVASVLEGRIGIDASGLLDDMVDPDLVDAAKRPSAGVSDEALDDGGIVIPSGSAQPKQRKLYAVVGRTAVIPVHGSLVNRGAWIGSYSGMTSYDGIKRQLAAAVADSDVANIVLDIDSPGGEATGAFETGAFVGKVNARKPVVAMVNGLCCSAAYAIASHAGRIVTGPTSIVGSIGVVMMHVDRSEQLRSEGVKPTFIYAGSHKVDGNSAEPLTDDVKSALQASVDKLYGMFVDHVVSGRKSLSALAVRRTEARTFIGADAVDMKLADAVGSFESTLAEMQTRSTIRRTTMSTETPAPAAEAPAAVEAPAVATPAAEAPVAPVVAAAPAADAAALDAARAEGAAAERARINAIISLPEAQGREGSAMHLAMTTSMSAEQVKPVLAGLPAVGAKAHQASGLGLVVSSSPAAPAASGWDGALKRAGASLLEKKR